VPDTVRHERVKSTKAVAAIEPPARHQPRSKAEERLLFARTCYDHLAGRLGVAIVDSSSPKAASC